MNIDYERMEWEDYPSTETPISAENLNHLEEGIAGLYSERYEMQSNIAYVEDGETASKDFLPNSYLMREGLFYKVTQTILYGDSFDSGEDGNITHVDISSQFGSGGGGSTGCVELTQAQYDALADDVKMLDVIYLITDSPDNYLDEVFGDFAYVEYTDTASKAYAVGDYLVYDSKFYKVTSAISQGDTIVPNTNVVKTTVADEFSNASNVDYNNSTSGLTATNMQGVADELASRTGVVYSTNHVLTNFNAQNDTIYSGVSLSLPPGKYVVVANTVINSSVANQRQGLTITTSNTKGQYNAWVYNLSQSPQTATINQYYNVCAILTPSVTTTYYAMIFNGNCTATATTTMAAIKIA